MPEPTCGCPPEEPCSVELDYAALAEDEAPKPPEYAIESGWLVEVVNEHTCGAGADGYGHEPGCGMVPVANLADLLAARDRRVRAEALREAADNWPREVNGETIRREIATFDLRETPPEYRVDQWLRDRADRIEAER